MGGEIITSIPAYGQGWNVTVDTNGIIDNAYTYLFYESQQPNVWQNDEGWIVKAGELETFFRQNMARYGFKGKEIEDFIAYWLPRLNDAAYYSVYPQTEAIIEDVIQLSFSELPDNIRRLFYVIEGHAQLPAPLAEPDIDTFQREGFYVAEWGVILW
jgi:hypothetical protein